MNRGIITLTKEEAQYAYSKIEYRLEENSPLMNKLEATENAKNPESIPIEVSEDEVEIILDEIILPSSDDPKEVSTSLRHKLQAIITSFRK